MDSPPIPEVILAAARHHLESVPPPRGLRWKYPWGQRIASGWLFPYAAEWPQPSIRPVPGFGFAPGFVVADDGSVRVLGETELRDVLNSEK